MTLPVSVLVPCYNESSERLNATVRSALESGASEVVVCNDGSDKTPHFMVTSKVTLLHQPNGGIASALNKAFEASTQEWVSWLSVGDTMKPEKLETQMAFNNDRLAWASFHNYHDTVQDKDIHPREDWQKHLWRDNQFCGSTVMVHRSAVIHSGGWDDSLRYSVDWKFALAVEYVAGWDHLPEVLGSAGEYLDGHTHRAMGKMTTRKRKNKDRVMVNRWATAHYKSRRAA